MVFVEIERVRVSFFGEFVIDKKWGKLLFDDVVLCSLLHIVYVEPVNNC